MHIHICMYMGMSQNEVFIFPLFLKPKTPDFETYPSDSWSVGSLVSCMIKTPYAANVPTAHLATPSCQPKNTC